MPKYLKIIDKTPLIKAPHIGKVFLRGERVKQSKHNPRLI